MASKTRTRARTKKPTAPARDTQVDLRHPLPTRRIVGPHTTLELTCARAALASAAARLPIPVTRWQPQPDGHAGAHLTDGTLLIHTADDGRAPAFTAYVPCPHGAHHEHPVTDHATLTAARARTTQCTTPHTTGKTPAPAAAPSKVLPLSEGLHRARSATAETTELSLTDIADGLEACAAQDQPKEHPKP